MIGGVSGLIVGPCTGPILAVALGAIALTLKDVHGADYVLQVVKGGFLLFLFGFGQGALILIAGMFTGFLSRLPRAGAWMEMVKKGFALVIIITASLLFVFVGQNTDFPSLTRLLAGSPSPEVSAPMATVSMESHTPDHSRSFEKSGAGFHPRLAGRLAGYVKQLQGEERSRTGVLRDLVRQMYERGTGDQTIRHNGAKGK